MTNKDREEAGCVDIIRRFTWTLRRLGVGNLDLKDFDKNSTVHLFMGLINYWEKHL